MGRYRSLQSIMLAEALKRVYELLITDYRIQREPDEINLYPKHWITVNPEFE